MNGVLAPQFKSLNCALWYTTRAHCATRHVRLLVPVLSKPCAIIVFGIQLGWQKCHLECILECIGIGVRKYMAKYYFLCIYAFYHVLLGCFFVVCLDPSLAKDGCWLACSTQKDWLACITQSITHVLLTIMQHTNYYWHAAHKKWFVCITKSWLTCSPFRVIGMFWLESQQKLKNTHVFTAHKCQLWCELYCM